MIQRKRRRGDAGPWVKAAVLVTLFGGLTAALWWAGAFRFFLDGERMARFLQDLGPWSFAGLILLQAVQVVVAPIPGEATGMLAGFLFGPLLGTALSTVGLTVGSVLAFLLARAFGRPLVDRIVNAGTVGRFDFLLHRKGAFLVFLLFLLPGFPKDYLCYLLGLGSLSLVEFVLISGAGRLLGTGMLAFGGHFLREGAYLKLSLLTGAAVVAALLALAYKDKLEKWFKDLRARPRTK